MESLGGSCRRTGWDTNKLDSGQACQNGNIKKKYFHLSEYTSHSITTEMQLNNNSNIPAQVTPLYAKHRLLFGARNNCHLVGIQPRHLAKWTETM